MIRRISRDRYFSFLEGYYCGASGQHIGAAFVATFHIGMDNGELMQMADNNAILEIIEANYVEPPA